VRGIATKNPARRRGIAGLAQGHPPRWKNEVAAGRGVVCAPSGGYELENV